MFCEFKTSTEAVGLGIHSDKTKILSNQDKEKAKEITVDNIKIEVLSKGDSARYLGQKITFEEQETEEIKNRLKAAWAALHKYRQELTSKDYRLCHRIRHFSMVITPTLTYASGAWTLISKTRKNDQDRATKDASPHCTNKKKVQIEKMRPKKWKRRLRSKQMKKAKVRPTKKPKRAQIKTPTKIKTVSFQEDAEEEIDSTENEEDWIDYIKRSTKEADEHMEKHKIPC